MSLIAERLITCCGGNHDEAKTPQHTSLARRGKSQQCMPQLRDCMAWLRAGHVRCRPVRMGSEGRQQEALITYSQRPVLCILFCHHRPSSQTRMHRSTRFYVQASLPSPSERSRQTKYHRNLFKASLRKDSITITHSHKAPRKAPYGSGRGTQCTACTPSLIRHLKKSSMQTPPRRGSDSDANCEC